ncbi:unnamed protein product [Ixodes pacificus]
MHSSQRRLGVSQMPQTTPVPLLDGIDDTSIEEAHLRICCFAGELLHRSMQGSLRLLVVSQMPQPTPVPLLVGKDGTSIEDAPALQASQRLLGDSPRSSMIMTIPRFSPVDGFIPDYQHCVCLGVMWQLWLDNENHNQPWYAGTKLVYMNAILLGILPTTEATRKTRKFEDRTFWKAS